MEIDIFNLAWLHAMVLWSKTEKQNWNMISAKPEQA